jgi:hypothetical protein
MVRTPEKVPLLKLVPPAAAEQGGMGLEKVKSNCWTGH